MAGTRLLKNTPVGIGGSTSLRTLSKVIIERGNGFKITELKGLSDLQGALSIEGLEKVKHPNEANDANLQEKKGLDNLQLVWSNHAFDDFQNPTIEYNVLEKLRPHSKLKKLSISGYGGMKFPIWLGDPSFDQLTELRLTDCENCTELPTLEHLTSLEKLEVLNCSKLVSIKEAGSTIMGSLRDVKIEKCDSLESYCCPNSVEKLRVLNCSKLVSIKGVGSSIMPCLKQVTIRHCDSLESYCCPNSVENLEIENCDSMTSLRFSKWQGGLPSSSASLSSNFKVRFCKNLKSIGEEEVVNMESSIMHVSFRQVTLYKCDSLESCCCPNSVEKLEVRKCSKLVSIKGVGSSIMPSLRQVEITNCDSLESYCCPNSVERLEIQYCSSMT